MAAEAAGAEAANDTMMQAAGAQAVGAARTEARADGGALNEGHLPMGGPVDDDPDDSAAVPAVSNQECGLYRDPHVNMNSYTTPMIAMSGNGVPPRLYPALQ
jgi:hypothetical protein